MKFCAVSFSKWFTFGIALFALTGCTREPDGGPVCPNTGQRHDSGHSPSGKFISNDAYEWTPPYDGLRPDDWSTGRLSGNRAVSSIKWAPRDYVRVNDSVTKIDMEPDRGLVVDHGIWWDSNLENDNESWKRLVYIFVDFKPVKYRLKTYETSTDQITDLTLFDERDMVQSLDSKFTHNIEIPKDKETIFTVQIPNEAFSPGIHDVRIVKVHREQDELSFGQTSGEWTFLVKKGDVQSTSKINETTEKVEVIQAPQSVRTPIRSFGILIEEENGISRSGFPPQTSGKPGESVTLDTWMKGKRTKDETEFVRTLVTGGEVVGNGPTRLTLPRFQTSPTGTEVPRVARVSNSVVVPDGNLRAFLFSEPFCREGIILTESWSSNVLRY